MGQGVGAKVGHLEPEGTHAMVAFLLRKCVVDTGFGPCALLGLVRTEFYSGIPVALRSCVLLHSTGRYLLSTHDQRRVS